MVDFEIFGRLRDRCDPCSWVESIQNTRRERIFATAVWMCTGVLQNQNKLARVAQGYGKRRGVVTNFIVTLNNLYLLKNNVERQSIY